MKNFIQTLKNIWSIEDLRKRILITLAYILIFRIGSYVVLPGIDADVLAQSTSSSGGGLGAILAIFTGGAFNRASIFALGIMPYISASIIMQLLGIAVPTIQKLQREGESGRKRITQWTRFLTIAICMLQAPGFLTQFVPPQAIINNTTFWMFSSVVTLTAGCLFVMWLGEKITDRGIGNGISILIMIGIIAGLPGSLFQEIVVRLKDGGMVILLLEMVFLLLVTLVTILLVQGTRRIPVNFAKRVVGNRQYQGARQYIPLKVNASGVMPIIFAQAIMVLPLYLGQAFDSSFFNALGDFNGFWYNLVFALMIIIFTYFYTAITVNPNEMANQMKQNGGFIPGVKPGKKTAEFIDSLLSRITLPGSIFLAIIAILPAIMMNLDLVKNQGFAYFYGGTSLLIMVGVVLDTLQQIESHLLMRHYDGLMKSGKIKGRNTGGAMGMAI